MHLPWARSLEILWQGPGIAHQHSLVQQVRAFYICLLWKAGSGYTPCRNLTLCSLFVWVEFTLLRTFVRPQPNPISKKVTAVWFINTDPYQIFLILQNRKWWGKPVLVTPLTCFLPVPFLVPCTRYLSSLGWDPWRYEMLATSSVHLDCCFTSTSSCQPKSFPFWLVQHEMPNVSQWASGSVCGCVSVNSTLLFSHCCWERNTNSLILTGQAQPTAAAYHL